jgi:Amt family ammonium transporter
MELDLATNQNCLSRLERLEAQVEALTSSQRLLGDASQISDGDTAWVLCAAIWVIFMTIPGQAIFYAGAVRTENVLATAMQVYSITALMTVLWLLCGYSLAFGPASPNEHSGGLYGDFSRMMLVGMKMDSVHQVSPTIPEPAFCLYQLTFAIAAPALMCGSFAERTRYTPILVFMGIWQLLVYCPLAHCFWHPDGFLFKLGVMDTAGGCVIHTAAGVASLCCIKIIGNRRMRDDNFREQSEPHDILFTVIGACMMWAAWFGFNAGGAQGGSASTICIVTQISASMASFSWLFVEWYHRGTPSVLGMVNGGVAGLTCITPAAGFVDAQGAACIGLIGGVAVYYGIRLKNFFGFDDAIDAFGVNATGGILGILFAAVFATKTVCPYSGFIEGGLWVGLERLGVQSLAVVFTVLWSSIISLITLVIIDETMGLRVTALQEKLGLDVALHHESVKHGGNKSVLDSLTNLLDSRSATPEPDHDDYFATEETVLQPGELLYTPSAHSVPMGFVPPAVHTSGSFGAIHSNASGISDAVHHGASLTTLMAPKGRRDSLNVRASLLQHEKDSLDYEKGLNDEMPMVYDDDD